MTNCKAPTYALTATFSSTDLLDLSYGYGSSNNGRIRSRTDALQPEHSVNYTFDPKDPLEAGISGEQFMGNYLGFGGRRESVMSNADGDRQWADGISNIGIYGKPVQFIVLLR